MLLFLMVTFCKKRGTLNIRTLMIGGATFKDPCQEMDSMIEDYQQAHKDKETVNQLLQRLIYFSTWRAACLFLLVGCLL